MIIYTENDTESDKRIKKTQLIIHKHTNNTKLHLLNNPIFDFLVFCCENLKNKFCFYYISSFHNSYYIYFVYFVYFIYLVFFLLVAAQWFLRVRHLQEEDAIKYHIIYDSVNHLLSLSFLLYHEHNRKDFHALDRSECVGGKMNYSLNY